MIILICGAEGSGKTALAKPLAKLLNAMYVTKDSYANELKGYIDGMVAAGKTVVVDKRCSTNAAVKYLNPDYVVWLDTIEEKIERPIKVNYHVAEWFDDTHKQLAKVVAGFMEKS